MTNNSKFIFAKNYSEKQILAQKLSHTLIAIKTKGMQRAVHRCLTLVHTSQAFAMISTKGAWPHYCGVYKKVSLAAPGVLCLKSP